MAKPVLDAYVVWIKNQGVELVVRHQPRLDNQPRPDRPIMKENEIFVGWFDNPTEENIKGVIHTVLNLEYVSNTASEDAPESV